ncbi:hypothetical protein P8452_42350 [Trifolium repens]|nr:hypothetical protein P8452_42350 [Trifolium repens]
MTAHYFFFSFPNSHNENLNSKHTISIFHRPNSQISLFRRRRTIPPPSKNYLSLTPSSVDQPQPLRALSHG